MGNRFRNLELEQSHEHVLPAATSAARGVRTELKQEQRDDLRDQHHWMREADRSRRRGAHEDALRYYSRAVELDRALVPGWVGQVRMLIALDEYPEAELWARKALELFRNHAELLAARAQALCRRGDLNQAQATSDAALAQPGMSSYPWVVRGELMLALRNPVDEYCFDKAAQLDGDWLVLLEIAAIYVFYRRTAKALTRCRAAAERAPDEPYCWLQRAACEAAMGMTAAAKRSLRNCLELDPKHTDARARLCELERRGRSVGGLLRRLFGVGRGGS